MAETQPRRRGWAVAALTAATLVVIAAIPQSRAIAQDLWHRFFLRSFDAVRLDLSRVPMSVSVTTNGMQRSVATLQEAELQAGYKPILPLREIIGDPPSEISVTGPIGVRQIVQVKELQAALARAGANEIQVPAEWQGITLGMDFGSMVIAGYKDDVQIIQAKPIELHVPAGFPLAKFAEAAFRSAGASSWTAYTMGEKFAKNPAWLLDIPEDEVVNIQEISLRAGSGLLVEDPLEGGGLRVTVLFGTPDRIFAVSSGFRELSIRIANSLR